MNAFYSDDPSLSPAAVYSFHCINIAWKEQKEAAKRPFKDPTENCWFAENLYWRSYLQFFGLSIVRQKSCCFKNLQLCNHQRCMELKHLLIIYFVVQLMQHRCCSLSLLASVKEIKTVSAKNFDPKMKTSWYNFFAENIAPKFLFQRMSLDHKVVGSNRVSVSGISGQFQLQPVLNRLRPLNLVRNHVCDLSGKSNQRLQKVVSLIIMKWDNYCWSDGQTNFNWTLLIAVQNCWR